MSGASGAQIVFLFAFSAVISFGAFTNLAWDDWYITFRASKNLALGHGLTFTPGERVHSFTSPLGALIPAFLSWIGGAQSDDSALWMFRVANAATLGLAAVILLKIGLIWRVGPWLLAALLAMVILDAKLLANSSNGMETAIFVFFLFATIWAHQAGQRRRRIALLGLAWAGMMWTRPDGCIYIAALGVGFWIFNPGEHQSARPAMLREFALAGLIASVLYVPWLVWAWSYYGSFVPHTIIAKGLSKSATVLDAELISQMARFAVARWGSWNGTFMPPYGITFGGWPAALVTVSALLSWLAAMAWLAPPLRPATRALSFTALCVQAYLSLGMEFPFPWYYPPVMALTVCVLILILQQGQEWAISKWNRAKSRLHFAFGGLAFAGVLGTAAVTTAAAIQLGQFQEVIYRKNYQAVGLWLRDHATSPRDTVFLEPLGYIGFFSNLKMYDYPGLSSEEVIEARRKFPVTELGDRKIFADLIPYMQPDWLVLRPREVALVDARDRRILDGMYLHAKTFDVSREVAAIARLPGRPWFELDQTFLIYRRVSRGGSTEAEAKTFEHR